jgi:hypothetical protein
MGAIVMKRKYRKLIYQGHPSFLDVEEAIRQEDYRKVNYLPDNSIGRIDSFAPGEGLVKVSYQQIEPPFDAALDEHLQQFPSALCEFVTPPSLGADGLRVVQSYLYLPSKILDRRYEGHIDEDERLVKRIRIGLDGQRGEEVRETYDKAGNLVKSTVYDTGGGLVREVRYGDWT